MKQLIVMDQLWHLVRDAAIRRLFAPYRLGGRHGHRFWRKKSSCGVVKTLFEYSVKMAQNGPSTQLIKATSTLLAFGRSSPTSTVLGISFRSVGRHPKK
jgi:hypothetical protein